MKNPANNPMDVADTRTRASRCGAKTRSGHRCRNAPMPNGRCYYHGGPSPGAPLGNRNALKHGGRTAANIESRRVLSAMLRAMRDDLASERQHIGG